MTGRTAHVLCGVFIFVAVSPVIAFAQRTPGRFRVARPHARARARVAPLPDILRRVVEAAPTLRLSGHRVVDQKVRGLLVRHQENVLRVGPRTRIWFPPGSRFAGQIIVDNGTFRWRFNPRNQQVHQEPSQRDDVLARLVGPNNRLLAPFVTLADGGLVAGIHTTLARIQLRQGATVQTLYVDPNTGAVLKRIGYDKFGKEVANYEFTSVNYNPTVTPSDFEPPRSPKPIVTPEITLRRMANRAGLPPLVLRPGQRFLLFNSNVANRANVQVLHEVYVGPRGKLSVFLLRAQVDPAKLVRRAGKLTNAYATQINGVTVVLVGPYTQARLQHLATTLVNP
ncbi:MAG: LolA family protein [Fimbriimonadaceae bacterium]